MAKRGLQLLVRWVPAVGWMCTIFSASTDAMSNQHTSRFFEPFLRSLFPGITQERINQLHLLVRKGGHLTEYAILAVLLWWALGWWQEVRANRPRRAVLCLLLAALYAASDEFHQSFVPSRGAAVTDVLIDTSGAALGLLGVALLLKIGALWSGRPQGEGSLVKAS